MQTGHHMKTSHVTNITCPFLTCSEVIQPFPIKITLGLAFFQFYRTLSCHHHPTVTKSKSHGTPLQILSIESFITELIGLPVHHNSKNVSKKLLRHLSSIGDL